MIDTTLDWIGTCLVSHRPALIHSSLDCALLCFRSKETALNDFHKVLKQQMQCISKTPIWNIEWFWIFCAYCQGGRRFLKFIVILWAELVWGQMAIWATGTPTACSTLFQFPPFLKSAAWHIFNASMCLLPSQTILYGTQNFVRSICAKGSWIEEGGGFPKWLHFYIKSFRESSVHHHHHKLSGSLP